MGTVLLIGPWGSELIQDCWARGPAKDVYPSEDTILLGSMRPRTIGTWSYCDPIPELGHRKG